MYLTDIFLKIMSMSLTAAYCVLFICIARIFLRRAPKVFSYLLWSIVAVRLLCPITFESNFSLIGERLLAFTGRIETGSPVENMISAPSAESPVTAQAQLLPNPSSGMAGSITGSGSSHTENTLLSSGTHAEKNHDVNYNAADSNTGNSSAGYAENASLPEMSTDNKTVPSHPISTHRPPRTMMSIAACIWLTGMLGLFVYYVLSCLHLHRRLADKAVYSRHYKGIPVYEVTGLGTPFVTGLAKPVIYLPEKLENWEACQCLAHEYTHICRKDYLVKQFAFLLTCVYWFQPLVWLAFHLMTRDMEMSCDEITLRNADLKDRKAYSNALVRLSSETRRISGCPLAFSENNTSYRIKNILNLKKPAGWMLIVCSALLLVFAAGLLANPAGSSANAGSPAESLSDAEGSERNIADADSSLSPANRTQASASADRETKTPLNTPMEDPYNTYIPEACQELQAACRASDTERAAELQREMKDAMTSYWTYLVEERARRTAQNETDQILNNGSGDKTDTVSNQLYLLETMTALAKAEMNYVNKTIDAIEGSVNVVKTSDYETAYPLYGTLAVNDTIVRSMPKDSAPQVDTLEAGAVVSIVSFGKYMLQEDINFRNFFLSDPEIQQEYQNYAVILYQSKEDNGKTTRKGYIRIDSLEISGSTAETYMYWIGKAWSEAFCCQDGATLYQMSADKKDFLKWDYISGIHDTEPVQVEFNPAKSYPQHFYQVHILTGKSPEGGTASDMNDLALQFFVQTPEPNVWIQRQNLKIAAAPQQLRNIKRIEDLLNNTVYFSEIDNYEQITSCSEYQDACLSAYEYGPCYFDFKGSGYAALYNPNDSAGWAISRYSSEEIEILLEKYLNLSGGSGKANILTLRVRDADSITGLIQLAYVEYTFTKADANGQNKISIPMYYDEEGYWYIWIPGQNEALDEAIYGVLENFPIKAFG